MKKKGIHIFRRDLRLEDNTALNTLAREVDEIIPVFIFDERQVGDQPYRGAHAVQFLCESLTDLDADLRARGGALLVQSGVAEKVIAQLIKTHESVALSYNRDYTPFSIARDEALAATCAAHNVRVIAEHDAVLHPPGTVVTKEGKPYSVYTHYRVAAEALPIPMPQRLPREVTFSSESGEGLSHHVAKLVPEPAELRTHGGRSVAKKLLTHLNGNSTYAIDRDMPSVAGTSLLSAHIKFGTVSVREVYQYARTHMKPAETFLREVLWHDFFTTVAALAPRVYRGAYRAEFDALEWNDDEEAFSRWADGTTGFPIVDAGMRELRETGYMHNRVRMIVASFLVKDLHVDWRKGERHFARFLSDYDPAVNNGNWQWVAGTGCDASPWFRIFNPWLQQKKFDPACAYIKRWVPELSGLSDSDIHDEQGSTRIAAGYPAPMCDHRTEAQRTKEIFSRATQKSGKIDGTA